LFAFSHFDQEVSGSLLVTSSYYFARSTTYGTEEIVGRRNMPASIINKRQEEL
jgi:hypothetical protein